MAKRESPAADVPALRAFVAVARLGTVGRAARSLGRTQPSISARLAALERAWGTRLFRRKARGMTLTPEGARLLPLAESSLRGLEELDRAAGAPLADTGELRVGAGDALGRERLPRALTALMRERPDLAVRIVEGPSQRLVEALRSGEIDLALIVAPPEGGADDVECRPLLDSPVDLLVPRGWPGGGRGSIRLASLRDRRLVTLQPSSGFRRRLQAAFAERGLPFRPAVEVGNLSLVRRYVAAGLGVAPVPAVAFGAAPGGPAVERSRLVGVGRVTYYRATRKGVPLPEACAELLKLLV
jgi:LysR family hydrogen peroxide-inducible transcriptional activator